MGIGSIARRSFLGLGVAAAGGLAVGYYFYRRPYANPVEGLMREGGATFNHYVAVDRDGTITVFAPRAEMGQGVETTLAALVVEEMDLRLDQVTVAHGPPSPAYYNAALFAEWSPFPFFDVSGQAEITREGLQVLGKMLGLQITAGSSSAIDAYVKMRQAGAAARAMLIAAASRAWAVPAGQLETERGEVVHEPSQRRVSYAALAETASRIEPPAEVRLRDRRDWQILGRPQRDVRGPEKVTGAPIFAIDVDLPDMLYGTVRMSPRFGTRHARIDRDPALAVPGVREVVGIGTGQVWGFGVIADNTWAAFRGAAALEVEWEPAQYPPSATEMAPRYAAAFEGAPSFSMGGSGEPDAAFAEPASDALLSAEYGVPFLAHACMEPMNATARVAGGRAEVWAGTQAPTLLQDAVARQLGIGSRDVTVHVTHLGGGFGRRAEVDFALYAAELARHTRGRPIKVTWTREEDIRHDAYRPAARARIRAIVPEGKPPSAIEMRVAAPSVLLSAVERIRPGAPVSGPDKSILEGAFDQPYAFRHSGFHANAVDLPIPVGYWRSVGHSHNSFFLESFLDEAAHKAGLDPLELRLALMGDDPRFEPGRGVLRDVTERAGWGSPLPDGSAQGLAFVLSYGAWVGQVVQVASGDDGIVVEKVWCTADPGVVLDPGTYEAQLISGIAFGLSQAIAERITFAEGEVVQANFDDYPVLRMRQSPAIEVALRETSSQIGGAGEVGTPPAAPALANAVFAATGQRIRDLPLGAAIKFA